ncbi:hypothetical protein E0H26_22170 [Micromonospora zingiberis]|uniref:HEAT repeat domain-containing protein n=1 Tax=Micromonospora zingiberis TaxID=2053011 RepID=A0A4R0GBQ5_9ACTN|nr:hypothetical protein [Micromonospora zingiberis]TCB93473.1 hypothetical protein E0H26_22170 [Micromonospora zingiberis]
MFGTRRQRDELAAAVAVLADAETVSFGGVGLAGTLLPETEAYQRVEAATADHPDEVRGQLERLLSARSPAARVYAATLLERLDPVAGRAAWAGLRADSAEVNTATGCVLGSTTVGEYAADRLAGS